MTGVDGVRWGIVSTARINAKLLAGAREAAGVDVIAVGSRDPARGEAFAAEHGIGRAHGSYEDLLADPDPHRPPRTARRRPRFDGRVRDRRYASSGRPRRLT